MRLRSDVRRVGGGVAAAAACAAAAAALAGGGGALPRSGLAPVRVAAATPSPTGCLIPLLNLFCPTPTPAGTPGPTQPPGSSGKPGPTAKPGGPPPTLSVIANPNPVVIPLPTVAPAATPRFAPGSPDLAVQSIILVSLGGNTVKTGSSFAVQATCAATRGADTYAVANAHVTFTVSGAGSTAAAVTPAAAQCDATGLTAVSVTAGTAPGALVLSATSGGATGTLTVNVTAGEVPATATPSPVAAAPVAPTVTTSSGTVSGSRAVAIAGLLALAVAVLATTLIWGPILRRRRDAVTGAGAAPGGPRG